MSFTNHHPRHLPQITTDSDFQSTLRRLSIPFFSRSSSSFFSLPLSRDSNVTSTCTEFEFETGSNSTSPPLPITPTTPTICSVTVCETHSQPKSLGRDRDGRPGFKKMPSLSTLTIRSWSRSRSSLSIPRNRINIDSKKISGFRSNTNTNTTTNRDDLQLVTVNENKSESESKSKRRPYLISTKNVIPLKWKESKKQNDDHSRLSRGSISSFFKNSFTLTGTDTDTHGTTQSNLDKIQVHVQVDVNVDVEHDDDCITNSSTSTAPLVQSQLVSTINTKDANDECDYDYERARRGSDWPPSSARPMNIDLKGISTFAQELTSSANLVDVDSLVDADKRSVHAQVSNDKRADTPLVMPKLNLGSGFRKSTFLPPMVESPAFHEDIFEEMNGVMDKKERTPTFNLTKEEANIIKPPSPTHSSLKTLTTRSVEAETHKTQNVRVESEGESPQFNISIFSPRPNVPPAPVLRGLKLDTEVLPISPLELPTLRCQSKKARYPTPTPVLPRNTPCSPIILPSKSPEMNWMNISTALDKSSSDDESSFKITTSVSTPPHHRDGLHRVNRVRIPSGSHPHPHPHPRTTRSISISSHTSFTNTISDRDRVPTRRSSLIIRPSILPCPTPPSLITSPKSLGNANIPPLFSPSTIVPPPQSAPTSASASVSPFQFGNGNVGSGLSLSRRGRGSLRLHLTAGNGSTFSRAGMDIGSPSSACFANPTAFSPFPAETNKAVSSHLKVEESIEHVPTPGTFGLEGEADRQVVGSGVTISQMEVKTTFNPYFAI